MHSEHTSAAISLQENRSESTAWSMNCCRTRVNLEKPTSVRELRSSLRADFSRSVHCDDGPRGPVRMHRHLSICRFSTSSILPDGCPPRACMYNQYNRDDLSPRAPKIGIWTTKSAKNASKVLAFRQFLQLKTVKRRKVRYVWHPKDAKSQEAHWKLILWTADPCWISIESSGHTAIIQDDRLTRDWTC